MALLWPAFGPDLANRSGPPKCHHSTLHVGQIIIPHVPDVGRIWANNTLLSGYGLDPGGYGDLGIIKKQTNISVDAILLTM